MSGLSEEMLEVNRPIRRCSIEGCEREHWAHGLCGAHYQRKRKYGDPLSHIPITPRRQFCAVEGCDEKHMAKGYCKTHYYAWRTWGDPLISKKRVHITTHGTYNEYQNYGCRCDKCKRAMAHHNRVKLLTGSCSECGTPIWLTSPRRTGLCRRCLGLSRRTAEHGTETRYNGGCRCDDCKAASNAARRQRRHANLDASRAYERRRYYARREAVSA